MRLESAAKKCWNPYYRKDTELIEKVQRRATRMTDSHKKYSYHERLQRLQLTTLESRSVWGDLIEVYKIIMDLSISTTGNTLTFLVQA